MGTIPFSLALIGYYALHSLLAANDVKAKLTQFLPTRYYRLVFNLLAVVLLAAIIILYFLVKKKPLWPSNLLLSILGGIPVLFGISWVTRALKRYSLGEFSGLEQLRTGQQPQHTKLIITGLNGRVRHPLYYGMLLIISGTLLIFPTDVMLAFVLISIIYLVIGSRLEEEMLVAQFGKSYLAYQKKVPMLLPFRVDFNRKKGFRN